MSYYVMLYHVMPCSVMGGGQVVVKRWTGGGQVVARDRQILESCNPGLENVDNTEKMGNINRMSLKHCIYDPKQYIHDRKHFLRTSIETVEKS